jgi:hypothetical protein
MFKDVSQEFFKHTFFVSELAEITANECFTAVHESSDHLTLNQFQLWYAGKW